MNTFVATTYIDDALGDGHVVVQNHQSGRYYVLRREVFFAHAKVTVRLVTTSTKEELYCVHFALEKENDFATSDAIPHDKAVRLAQSLFLDRSPGAFALKPKPSSSLLSENQSGFRKELATLAVLFMAFMLVVFFGFSSGGKRDFDQKHEAHLAAQDESDKLKETDVDYAEDALARLEQLLLEDKPVDKDAIAQFLMPDDLPMVNQEELIELSAENRKNVAVVGSAAGILIDNGARDEAIPFFVVTQPNCKTCATVDGILDQVSHHFQPVVIPGFFDHDLELTKTVGAAFCADDESRFWIDQATGKTVDLTIDNECRWKDRAQAVALLADLLMLVESESDLPLVISPNGKVSKGAYPSENAATVLENHLLINLNQ